MGALFRTCEGFGADRLYLTGYTPYPSIEHGDIRLPHIARKLSDQIHKTALGAERMVPYSYSEDPLSAIENLRSEGYVIAALEQSSRSRSLDDAFKGQGKIALILGEEVAGVNEDLLQRVDIIAEIPMYGRKESFNVAIAAGIAMYALRQQR